MRKKAEPGFLGFPSVRSGPGVDAEIAILGAPHGTPYEPGARSHAASARDAARRDHYDFDLGGPLLPDAAVRVVDSGDVDGDPGDPQGNRGAIETGARRVLDAGAVPVLLGGDDSVPIPFLAAFGDAGPLWVVQIDAHLDWRDERGGERLGWSSTMRRISEMPHVEGMVQVGLRGVGSAGTEEVAAAQAWGSRLVPAADVHRAGVGEAVAHIPEDARCVITLDCDALDPSVMPGVLSRVPGGLSYAQIVEMIGGIARRGRLAGFDLVELAPRLDPAGLSALTAYRIVACAIGAIARQSGPAGADSA